MSALLSAEERARISAIAGSSDSAYVQGWLFKALADIAERERLSSCPCCTGGVSPMDHGRPCTECRGKGLAIVAHDVVRGHLKQAKDEIAELRKDKDRLDWMEQSNDLSTAEINGIVHGFLFRDKYCNSLRAAIDAAREDKV